MLVGGGFLRSAIAALLFIISIVCDGVVGRV